MKKKRIAKYIMIVGFLAMLIKVVAEEADRRRIEETRDAFHLRDPELPQDYDFVWRTNDPCPECAALEGTRYDKDTDLTIPLHPYCKCYYEKVYIGVAAMKGLPTRIKFAESGAVRAVLDGKRRFLEVLAAPFGSPKRKDKLNQFFSKRTDFMLEVGDRRPTLYFHGFSPQARMMEIPAPIGIAEVSSIDERGLWMKAELDDSPLSQRTWKAALKGEARASTGSVNYLERHDKRTGEVLVWPIAELSVFDAGDQRVPVSDDAIVLPLRAIFDECKIQLPDRFEAGKDKDEGEQGSHRSNHSRRNFTMDEIQKAVEEALAEERKKVAAEEAARAEMKKSIIDELKGDPKYKAIFNIASGEANTEGMTAEEEEVHAFLWNMTHPTQAPRAMRVLEESEALEGGGLIPLPIYNQIVELKDEYSLVAKLGIRKMFTNSLTLRVPRENAGMGVFATIAEEGAYIANEPAFAAVTCTVVKKGSMITVTEEMLEDQTLFQDYFVGLCARKWALSENLELFTKLKATATAGTHSATFTQPEIDAFMFQITEPWSDGAHLIMAQATMATIRGLLVATPRAYGDFPVFGGLEYPTFFGYPVHLNSNWEAVGAGDTTLTMSLVNPAALAYVERRGLSIKVDPYGDALNGRVRYFPSYRAVCEVIQVLGNVDYTDHA
jgi:HK97 family phage major capsid protein